MDIDPLIQLVIGLGVATAAFVAAYILPLRYVVPSLIIIAPFELISSRYGTSSTALVYLVTLALLLRGEIRRFPLGWAVAGLMFAYAVSLSMANVRPVQHLIYIIDILPGFFLFYIAYNYFYNNKDPVKFINVLLIINVLVIMICALQLIGGSNQVVLFGVSEFALQANRDTGRLSGPFGAEFTSEYLALGSLLLAYLIMFRSDWNHWPRWLLWMMLSSNVGFMATTGSRGGFVILIIGLVWGTYLFRRDLGTRRAIGILGGFTLIGSLVTVLTVQFTDFNVILDRFKGTSVEGGVIDTRSVAWPMAWEEIKKRPLTGFGPRLRLDDDKYIRIPNHKPISYPHSLPLFLLYTLGIVGLIAYIVFFALLMIRFYKGAKAESGRNIRSLSKIGFIILTMFLLDEVKIEFLRIMQLDYQAIIFSMLGGFLATADLAVARRHEMVNKL